MSRTLAALFQLDLTLNSALTTLFAILLFALALVLLALKPRDVLVRSLVRLVILAAFVALVRSFLFEGGLPAQVVFIGASGLLPAVFLSFCLQLVQVYGPDEEPALLLRARLFRYSALLALIASVIEILSLGIATGLTDATRPLLQGAQIVAYTSGYVFIVRHCIRTRGSRNYQALITIVIGLTVAYAPSLLLNRLPFLLGNQPILGGASVAALELAMPLAFGFATIRWRAGSIIALVDRISVYVAVAFVLVAAYVAVAFVFERTIDMHTDVIAQLVPLIFAAALAITFAPLQSRLRRFLDMRVFRDHYNYEQTLERFSSELARLHTQEEIIAILSDGITQTLNVEGTVFVSLPEGFDRRMLALLEDGDLHARGSLDTPDGRMGVLCGLAALSADVSFAPEKPLLVDPWPGCIALLLISSPISGEGYGLLMLGNKRTTAGLRRADAALLTTLANHAGTALANAVLVEGLNTSLNQVRLTTNQIIAARHEQQLLLRELVNADERQRAALAQDLHDDALQELLYLVRHSRLTQQLAEGIEHSYAQPSGPPYTLDGVDLEQAVAQFARLRLELGYLTERSAIAEHALRALCLGLYPALLTSLGLAAALGDLALDLSAATDMAVRVSSSDEAAEAAKTLTPEVALHAYRIVQEAVRNAGKHADSDEVEVTLACEPRHEAAGRATNAMNLRITIQDRGPGLELPLDFGELLRQGHLGLAGMRERAGRTGGEITFGIGPQGGTCIILSIPIEPRAPPLQPVETRTEASTKGTTR